MSDRKIGELVDLSKFRPKPKDPLDELMELPHVQLYRMTGFLREKINGPGATSYLQTKQRAPIVYTISTDRGQCETMGNTSFVKINKLNPKIDSGCVIVRHHLSEKESDTYMKAHDDMGRAFGDRQLCQYKNSQGYYTVLHRPTPEDTPDHLLVCIFTKEMPKTSRFSNLGPIDTYVIFHPDGSISTNPEILGPF